jgi:pimeloyl-ACP methyl ester carboxylesterase
MAFFSTKKLLLVLIVLVGLAWIGYRIFLVPEAVDTRFNGAYRFEDGRLGFVSPREGKSLRYREMSGASRTLWPTGDATFESGPGWSGREPVEVTVAFDADESARAVNGFSWSSADGVEKSASRIELPEILATFPSGELKLRGKLVLPLGEPPFPAIVFVHGSEKYSAVDNYFLPYLFASHGVAAFVYDKRGTGGSTGKYIQNFEILSDDTVAAVDWLRQRPEIEPGNIHLAGYSQGGWIAPLAATKTAEVKSLLIAYGPMVPVTGEDRWGYVWALQQKGFGEDAIGKADQINDVVCAIMDDGEDRWSELGEELDAARGQDWFEALAGSDGIVGFLAGTKMPLWVVRIMAWWFTRGDIPFIDRRYDPVPTVDSLDIPSLWLFGEDDSSMPTQWSVEELEPLQAEGRPIEFEVYPLAEHGILLMETTDSGDRRPTGYAPGYFERQVTWVREQAGLPAIDTVAVGLSASSR